MNRLEKNTVNPVRRGSRQSNGVKIDATNKSVGRLASEIAKILLGKDAPAYAPHRTAPIRVVVTKTDQMVFTGRKMAQKVWRRHSGFHGGLKETPAAKLMALDSRQVLARAVRGMLPRNRLLKPRLKQLTLYRNDS